MCFLLMFLKMNKEGKINRNIEGKLSYVENVVVVVIEIDFVLFSIVLLL